MTVRLGSSDLPARQWPCRRGAGARVREVSDPDVFGAPLCLPEGIQRAVVADASFGLAIALEVGQFVCPKTGGLRPRADPRNKVLAVSEQQNHITLTITSLTGELGVRAKLKCPTSAK